MKPKRRTKASLNLPRAPLPRQMGGAHKTKRDVLPRKRKHKAPHIEDLLDADEEEDYQCQEDLDKIG